MILNGHSGETIYGVGMTNIGWHLKAAKSLTIAVSVIAVAACGNDKPVKAGQALVKVNKEEITVHQLNTELKYAGAQAANVDKEKLQSQVVESLVDRQVLVDAAVQSKLDRDAEVMQLLERSKAQILAQTYLQRKMAALPRPTQVEITEYYRNNPELFAQRKLFELKHVMVSANDFTPEVKAATDSAKSVDEMATWLESKKIKFVKDQSNRTTADLPPNLLGQLSELAKGKPFIMKDASNVLVASLAFLKDVPVPEQAAYAQIERFLANKKMQQVATDEVGRLRKEATIVFLKQQGGPQSAATTAEPQTAPVLKLEGQPDNKHIERGVSGLK
jgi:peptidyl-prolyl cis-trans isomerase C